MLNSPGVLTSDGLLSLHKMHSKKTAHAQTQSLWKEYNSVPTKVSRGSVLERVPSKGNCHLALQGVRVLSSWEGENFRFIWTETWLVCCVMQSAASRLGYAIRLRPKLNVIHVLQPLQDPLHQNISTNHHDYIIHIPVRVDRHTVFWG